MESQYDTPAHEPHTKEPTAPACIETLIILTLWVQQ